MGRAALRTIPHFYPRSPCGERLIISIKRQLIRDFYPRSPCGERHNTVNKVVHQGLFLSTLSLRRATSDRGVSIRYGKFLSTLSLRRATTMVGAGMTILPFLSTLSLRRATVAKVLDIPVIEISIHALLAESDCCAWCKERTSCPFLSTLSLRRATAYTLNSGAVTAISIHALLAESDISSYPNAPLVTHFYPRSPCGERRFRRR